MLHRIFWGLLLIAAGTLFLLDRTGVITVDFGTLFKTYWPVFVIIFGLSGALSCIRQTLAGAVWNLIVCAVGVIFLLHNLNLTDFSVGEMFAYMGPVALILIGIALIFRGPRRRWEPPKPPGPQQHPDRSYYEIYGEQPPGHQSGQWEEWSGKAAGKAAEKADEFTDKFDKFAEKVAQRAQRQAERQAERWERRMARHGWTHGHEHHHHHHHPNGHHHQENSNEYISTFQPGSGNTQHKSGFIGDVYLGRDYWDLQPMTISHFIGDTIIDLTKANIPQRETKLVVSAFIGDVKMLVPADVDVEIAVSASSFIGDMNVLDRHESGLFRNISTETPYYRESERKIRLIVSAFIGDVLVQKVG
jgi:lia operon protein LiaF